jgi:hypothetical protein
MDRERQDGRFLRSVMVLRGLEVVVGLDNGRVAREGIRLDIVQLDNRRVARGVPVRL